MDETQIREWIGEIVVAGFTGSTINHHARRLIRHHKVRNIILFSRNVASMEQVQQLTLALRDEADYPLIICTDQENGIVRRVAPDLPGLPGNMAVSATGDERNAYTIGLATSEQLLTLGINMNLAPVLDVNNNPSNPVIGVRSFGESPARVARFGKEMIRGLADGGVITCAKHFPGHGDTSTDSHLSLPRIDHSLDRLFRVELVPFLAAIERGVDAIMSAHILFPSLEPNLIPATLSRRVLTDFLRGELGYQGIITTDCLEMDAIASTIGVGVGAVRAVQAGADLVMISHRLDRQEEAIEALVAAVKDGSLPLSRLEDAATRVRGLRTAKIEGSPLRATPLPLLRETAAQVSLDVSRQAVTLVRDPRTLLPVHAHTLQKVTVLSDATSAHMAAADSSDSTSLLAEAVRLALPDQDVKAHVLTMATTEALSDVNSSDLVIAGVNGTANREYVEFLVSQSASSKPFVVIALQSPYNLQVFPQNVTALAIYENTPWMIKAAVDAIFGGPVTGQLPVTL